LLHRAINGVELLPDFLESCAKEIERKCVEHMLFVTTIYSVEHIQGPVELIM
jgi:hypothetical protein